MIQTKFITIPDDGLCATGYWGYWGNRMRLTSECPPQRCRVCANPFRDFDLRSLTLLRSFRAEENSKQELRNGFSSNTITATQLNWPNIGYACERPCNESQLFF